VEELEGLMPVDVVEELEGLLHIPATTTTEQFLYDSGFSDGLPLVPPTPERVAWMMTGTDLPPDLVLGTMPPILSPCTVSNVAVNAVLAGCRPKHFRVVLAAVQGMLSPDFNLHGCHATTMGVTPLLIINGINIAAQAGLNSSHGALGSGQKCRANATIGRAVKLVLQNCGQALLGGTESTTIGGPRKYTMCLMENEQVLRKVGPWSPFRGEGEDVVTVHAVSSGVDQLTDTKCDRDSFICFMSAKIANLWVPALPVKLLECVVVISPEHYRMLSKSGIRTKEQLAQLLFDESNAICQSNLSMSLRVATINQVNQVTSNLLGVVGHVVSSLGWLLCQTSPVTRRSTFNKVAWSLLALWCIKRRGKTGAAAVATTLLLGTTGILRWMARRLASLTPKMWSPASIHIVVSGSSAGKFSCVMPGFGCGIKDSMKLSTCVTTSIPCAPANMESNAAALELVIAESDHVDKVVVCDPRGKCVLPRFIPAKRSSDGSPPRVLGLMDISKPGGSLFFDRLAALMKSRGVVTVRRYQKPTFSKQCPDALRRRIASECDAVVLALAD